MGRYRQICRERDKLAELADDQMAHVRRLLADCRDLQRRLEAVYQRTPAFVSEAQSKNANAQRMMVLAGVADDNPLWRTILSLIDEHERNQFDAVMPPNLDDANRHYNAGRCADAHDLASALRDCLQLARQQAKKMNPES